MSGGSLFGGGDAWKEEHWGGQQAVLDHAAQLKYPEWLATQGRSLPPAGSSKSVWTSAMDDFNAWKAREVAKEKNGQAWWQTYGSRAGPESGGGGGGGGSGSPPTPGSGLNIGPYPFPNDYHPLLQHAYTAPSAMNFSRYMTPGLFSGSEFVARYPQARFPGDPVVNNTGESFNIGGLLYQPWTTEYQQAFVPTDLWNYSPNQFNVGQPSFVPTGITVEYIEPEGEEEESSSSSETPSDRGN